MIADPNATRITTLLGAGPTSENLSVDKVAQTADGKGNTWRANAATTSGLRLDMLTSHDVTKAGRRRSVCRVLCTYVDSSVSPAAVYTSTFTMTLDQPDIQAAKDIVARNAAMSAGLDFFVTSRAAGADIVASAALTDWLNGEP